MRVWSFGMLGINPAIVERILSGASVLLPQGPSNAACSSQDFCNCMRGARSICAICDVCECVRARDGVWYCSGGGGGDSLQLAPCSHGNRKLRGLVVVRSGFIRSFVRKTYLRHGAQHILYVQLQ